MAGLIVDNANRERHCVCGLENRVTTLARDSKILVHKDNHKPKWVGPRRVSMRDVADAAGVSLITVSRSFREPELVKSKTRKKIEEAIQETGYVPNLAARSLQINRTNIIAVLLPALNNSVFALTAQGIADVLEPKGYQMMIGSLGDKNYIDAEEKLVTAFLGRRPDGFVLMAADHSEVTRRLLVNSGIPVVETWSLLADPIDMCVGVSTVESARALVHRLAAKGYSRIAMIKGKYRGNKLSDERGLGYELAMRDLGRPLISEHVINTKVPVTLDTGGAAVARLLQSSVKVDAVFCAGDVFAHGAMLYCLDKGIEIPGRLAIAGMGDLELSARIPPGLTTVRIDAYDIGRRAARMILAELDGRQPRTRVIDLGYEIIERGSA